MRGVRKGRSRPVETVLPSARPGSPQKPPAAMLGSHEAIATVAVRDIDRAVRFYEDTLGLERVHDEGGEAITLRTGGSSLLVYRSEFAGTNRGTAATWILGDQLDECVRDLESKGVEFNRYDMPGMRHEGSIHVAGSMRVAWFQDPDGNIHALVSG
jgi:catechol 2,3-dioxygenase-like lactoylglutathione lyase family enzyme